MTIYLNFHTLFLRIPYSVDYNPHFFATKLGVSFRGAVSTADKTFYNFFSRKFRLKNAFPQQSDKFTVREIKREKKQRANLTPGTSYSHMLCPCIGHNVYTKIIPLICGKTRFFFRLNAISKQ